MPFKVFTTQEFDKDIILLEKAEQERIEKILKQLKEQGGDVGKPLSGLTFFREKKFEGKRLYFLVYKELSVILVVGISNKKAQQATINRILLDVAEYQQVVFETLRKKGL